MLRRSLWLVIMMCSSCSTFSYTETEEDIRLTFGAGGRVGPIFERYARMRESGKNVIIDGQMISADAFGAFSLPGVCYTTNAVFSPHAAHASNTGETLPEFTKLMAEGLPLPLREWFLNSRWAEESVFWPHVGYERLQQLWPEGACAGAANVRQSQRPPGEHR